jgi:hypothetical protein
MEKGTSWDCYLGFSQVRSRGKELKRNKVLQKVLTRNFSHLVLKPHYLALCGAKPFYQTMLWGSFPHTQNCNLHPRVPS